MIDTSVLITTLNRPKLLDLAVRSALQNAGDETEILVVDDGSGPETAEVMACFSDRVRYFRLEPRRGRVGARNFGISQACGEGILFLDDDDTLLPGGLSALRSAFLDSVPRSPLIYGRPVYVQSLESGYERVEKALPGLGEQGDVVLQLLHQNFIQPGAAIADREALLQVGCFTGEVEPIALEDWRLWIRLALLGDVRFVDVEIAQILRHAGNTPDELFTISKCRYFCSDEFTKVLMEIKAGRPSSDIEIVGKILWRFAKSAQLLGRFSLARELCRRASTCGMPFNLLGPEQLWRSWIPRPGWFAS